MSGPESTTVLDDAKKIWPNEIGWRILGAFGLSAIAADFISHFSKSIAQQPPNYAQMLKAVRSWNALPIEQRRGPTAGWNSILPEAEDGSHELAGTWLPVEPDDSLATAVTPNTTSVTQVTPTKDTGDLIGSSILVPSTSSLSSESTIGFLEAQQVVTDASILESEIRELLVNPDFDPRVQIAGREANYIQLVLALKDRASTLFAQPINNAAEIWETVRKLINLLYERVIDINEKTYPLTVSEYEYIQIKAGAASRPTIEQLTADRQPTIEFVQLGPVMMWCCASAESYRDHRGDSSHGQDAVGMRQVLGPDGQVTGYHLLQADGVGQAFYSEFLARALINFLLQAVGSGERVLHQLVRGYQDVLTLEGEGLPDLIAKALLQTKEQSGSASTLNQLVIDTQGVVKGVLRGDGVLAVVRANGESQIFPFGSSTSALQTKAVDQYQADPAFLLIEDVVGGALTLGKGDTILLSSDGITHNGGEKVRKIVQLLAQNIGDTNHLKQKISEILWTEEAGVEDDQGLIVYRH